jgi:hypothetical protein
VRADKAAEKKENIKFILHLYHLLNVQHKSSNTTYSEFKGVLSLINGYQSKDLGQCASVAVMTRRVGG